MFFYIRKNIFKNVFNMHFSCGVAQSYTKAQLDRGRWAHALWQE